MNISNLAEQAEDFTGNIWYIDGSEKILVDLGTGDSWKSIRELEEVDKIVITHSHYDHVDNLTKVEEKYSPEIYAYKPENLEVDAKKISEDSRLTLSDTEFQVIHTPGHKDDSVCLYSEEEKILFTGDLIFPEGGFGRTDIEEGDRELLINSIKKITALDVDTFYPGHEDMVGQNANEQIQSSLEQAERRESKY